MAAPCLICYSKVSKPLLVDESTPSIDKNLRAIFILGNVLDIPNEQLQFYLSTWGSPECWIQVCLKCSGLVEDAVKNYEDVLQASNKFRNVKRKIVEKIRGSKKAEDNHASAFCKSLMPEVLIANGCRNFVNSHTYGHSSDPFRIGDRNARKRLGGTTLADPDPNFVKVESELGNVTLDDEGAPDLFEDAFVSDTMLIDNDDNCSMPDINITTEENPEAPKSSHLCHVQGCNRYFPTFSGLRNHQRKMHPDQKQLFSRRKRNVTGKRRERREGNAALKKYLETTQRCELCNLTFMVAELNAHMNHFHANSDNKGGGDPLEDSVTLEESLEQPDANVSISNRINVNVEFNEDEIGHTDTGKVFCPICLKGRIFPSKDLLRVHMELHKTSPHHCPMCLSVFRDRHGCNCHIAKYHPDIALNIKALRRKIVLPPNFHEEVPRTESSTAQSKSIKCTKCTRMFTLEMMPHHLALHESSPHNCSICGNVFVASIDLNHHITKYHKKIEDNDSSGVTGDKRKKRTRRITRREIMKTDTEESLLSGGEHAERGRIINQAYEDADADSQSESKYTGNGEDIEDDDDWQPYSSYTKGETGSTRKIKVSSKSLRPKLASTRKSISCPVCGTFQTTTETVEKLCDHLETCSDFNLTPGSDEKEICCPVCGQFRCSISSKSELCDHLSSCPGGLVFTRVLPIAKRIFRCSVCPTNRNFKLRSFLQHYKEHKRKSYRCTKCSQRFLAISAVLRHWASFHKDDSSATLLSHKYRLDMSSIPEVPWWCSICNEKFSNVDSRDSHVKEAHPTASDAKPHVCRTCKKAFFCDAELELHEGTSHVLSSRHLHICDVCQLHFLGPRQLLMHRRKIHRLDVLTCDVCGLECTLQESLEIHKQLHDAVRKHMCDECGESFSVAQYLRNHKFRKHTPVDKAVNPLVCTFCEKVFNNKTYLRKHIDSVHEGKYRFACHLCPTKLQDQSHMTGHLARVHKIGELKMYPCTFEGCNKVFDQQHRFKIHMHKHNNDPQYKCDFCEKAFYNSSHKKRHEHIHTNAESKPYQCAVCAKCFPVRNYLYIHMKSHNKDK